MTIFLYDKTFEGVLTAVFDAYFRKTFPEMLQEEGMPLPLFFDEVITVYSNTEKADRVWNALQKKLSLSALSCLTSCWLSELPDIGSLLFRYIRKAVDSPVSIEVNFGDPDVLEISQIWKKVDKERLRVMQFLRFQKAADDTFFAAIAPQYNVLPLGIEYFKSRFADQKWLIYDLKREYGYYYDLKNVTEVNFETKEAHLLSGILNDQLKHEDEKLFQQLWKEYFKATAIKERLNPKLHRQNMPARFWKYLTEKQ